MVIIVLLKDRGKNVIVMGKMLMYKFLFIVVENWIWRIIEVYDCEFVIKFEIYFS